MESHEVLREAFKKCGPKEIASELGLSLSLVYKWSQPPDELGSGSRNPLDRTAKLVELTRELMIVKWLCQQAGGYFLRNPEMKRGEEHDVFPSTSAIVQQFADLLTTITQAALDNEISKREAAEIRHVWDELKSFTEGFVRCCEEGDFKTLDDGLKARARAQPQT
jgi:hypothetical protein